MKRKALLLLLLSLAFTSCGFMNKKLTVDGAFEENAKIEKIQNPANRLFAVDELQQKEISLENLMVTSIVESTNYEYDYCVICETTYRNETVSCDIYSEKNKTISALQEGKSRIDVTGNFSRIVASKEKGTRIEILNAKITLLDQNPGIFKRIAGKLLSWVHLGE